MIFNAESFERVVRSREGSLESVPFAPLLYALARHERSVTLQINRPPLVKEIVIESGVPVACRSNLAHETLSRFMQRTGRLDDATATECLAESCAQGLRFGDVLLDRGLVTAEELLRVLQQNLAHKLLDGFSWQHGRYRIADVPPEIDSALRVNVSQLIVLGVSRFVTQAQIDGSVGPLIGTLLAVNPEPHFPLGEVRTNPRLQGLIEALATGPMRIDELARTTGSAFEEITRDLYALTLIEAVVPASQLPRERLVEPPPPPPQEESPPAEDHPDRPVEVSAERREELMQMVLNFRRKDAFDLLGVDPEGFGREYHDRFLDFAERFAPWGYGPELASDARRVFLAGARAYGELADPERRQALLDRRHDRGQAQPAPDGAAGLKITGDLLDPDIQYRKGRALMAERNFRDAITQLALASDLDPQNGDYRAELAYCRFLNNPAVTGPNALDELEDALRIDPTSGLAHYYRGDVLRRLGHLEEAVDAFRRAIKPMAPDRRPIDALRELRNGGSVGT